MYKLIFAWIFVISVVINAQQTNKLVESFQKRNYSQDSTTIPFRLYIPKKYDSTKKHPLVLALHGAGERGNDNQKQIEFYGLATTWADSLAQSISNCFVVAPQCPENNRWVDLNWKLGFYDFETTPISNELNAVVGIIDLLSREYKIDENRIYVTGLSMGGYATWDLLVRFPNKFAAAIPMSGGGDFNSVQRIKNTPLWVFHGAKDEAVPVEGSRKMIKSLEQNGVSVIYTEKMTENEINEELQKNPKHLYTEYPNGEHIIWSEPYSDPSLIKWLFSQTRKKN